MILPDFLTINRMFSRTGWWVAGPLFWFPKRLLWLAILVEHPKTVVNSKQPGPNISHQTPGKTPGLEFKVLLNPSSNLRLGTRPVGKRSSWVFLPQKFQPKRSAPTSLIHKRKGSIFGQRPELHGWARVQGYKKNLLDVWGKPKPWELLKDDIIQSSCKLGRWA